MDEDGEPVVRWEDDADAEGEVDEEYGRTANAGEGAEGEKKGEREGTRGKEDTDEPPEVPFVIIPGHHGGVVSHLSKS